MIPNVFVSSTIADLHYLREGIRDAILELAYNPVMSDYGGVGYISQGRASDACFITVKQCQLAILIIGKRYGSVKDDGLSVTHTEFITARENEVPLITFVDGELISYKKVFDADPSSGTWDKFPHMDNPRMTFKLVDEVVKAQNYNGMIEFTSASEAKLRLKQQIAHYVGDRLSGVVRPIKSDVSEILAEVKTLRNLVSQTERKGGFDASLLADSGKYYTALRFLLDERRNFYTNFVERLFGDLDLAVKQIVSASSLDEMIRAAGTTYELFQSGTRLRDLQGKDNPDFRPIFASEGVNGSWAMLQNRKLLLTDNMWQHLNQQHEQLKAKLSLGAGSQVMADPVL